MTNFWHNVVTTTKHLLVVLGLLLSLCVLPRTSSASITHSYIVQLAAGVPESILNRQGIGSYSPLFPNISDSRLQNVYSVNSTSTLEDLQSAFGVHIVYIETAKANSIASIFLNDPWFTSSANDVNSEWFLPKTHFIESWAQTRGSALVTVAVIDTGIDSTHEDLAAIHYVPGYDFLQDKSIPPGTSTDANGHGTLITGILAATPDNNKGIAGAVRDVSIMPLVALDKDGYGSSVYLSKAIVWAADHGADIINLSLSDAGTGSDVTLANAITYAFKKNVLIVAAAGNDKAANGKNLDDDPLFPVCADNSENMVLGVGATDYLDIRPSFSNYGKSCIDVSAPGKRIISTVNVDPSTKQAAPNAYAYASGTSVAVPLVVGEAVLLKSKNPYATNKQLRDAIISSAEKIDHINWFSCNGGSCAGLIGSGRIDVAHALQNPLVNTHVQEGNLVQAPNGLLYLLRGGKRQPVSSFVRSQRFAGKEIISVTDDEVAQFPIGAAAAPLDGALVKSASSPTVYFIRNSVKLPITSQVFKLRDFSFVDVYTVSDSEISGWLTGSFLSPPEATVLKTPHNPTIYWVLNDAIHPVTYAYYKRYDLHLFTLRTVTEADLKSFARGAVLY